MSLPALPELPNPRPGVTWRRLGLAVLGGLGCCALPAQGQTAYSLVPTLTVDETATRTTQRLDDKNGYELITRLSPGFRWSNQTGRVRGVFDYNATVLNRIRHGDRGQDNELQNALNASLMAEVVSNMAFIDAQASISQQSISAFGQQSADGGLQRNDNRTEVATLSIAPSLRGSLAGMVDVELRANTGGTAARNDSAPRSVNSGGSLLLRSAGRHLLDWSLSGTEQRIHYRGGATTQNERLSASLGWTPLSELQLTLRGGRERTDNGVDAVTSTNNVGGEVRWRPSQRTSLSLDADRRYFGNSTHLTFEHRTPRSVWRYNLTLDATRGADGIGVDQPVTLFQLLYEQLASVQPDPLLRGEMVLALLKTTGQDGQTLAAGGFLNGAVSVQRRQDLSFAYNGLRSTFTFRAFYSEQRTLATSSTPEGEPVRQFGYSGGLSHRLTPKALISLTGSRTITLGNSTNPGTNLRSASLILSNELTSRASSSLGARHSVFGSTSDPYRESALTGSLSLRF